ncbi:MAG TPA: hypothetical protein VM243_02375 [Phycisphaerae bacterium]|nr:hypothetical protein [Phycisphaerae bacterium]
MFSVYFDDVTGRPNVREGEAPRNTNFVAAFLEEGDADRLKSELAADRIVRLGLVRANPTVDDLRDERVRALYGRAVKVSPEAPFSGAVRATDESLAAQAAFVAVTPISHHPIGRGVAAYAGPGEGWLGYGFGLPAAPPL